LQDFSPLELPSMNTSTDDWRAKYLESLRTLESEEQRFRATESILKRLTGRLCIACLGLSPKLDKEIKKLQTLVRRENAATSELEEMMTPLSDAVIALDDKPGNTESAAQKAPVETVPSSAASTPGTQNQTIPDESNIRAAFSTLLSDLKRDPELSKAAEALDSKLSDALTLDRMSPLLASLTDIVGQRIARIENARREAEALLEQLVGRLDEISKYIVEQSQTHNDAMASSESLNSQLTGEIKAMSSTIEASSDLKQIRDFVRNKLESIGRHLFEFRQRESERVSVMRARNDEMQKRVTELEAEANKLQTQLQAEQQVSMVDALTKIPNRLAYDKRITQELQRWKRFGHPVCIAVWDVDHFKKVNDTYGHRAGDRVLCSVADHLSKNARSTDFVARYGGEEFVMLLAGTNVTNALQLVDKLRTAIGKLGFHYSGQPVSITISCGLTELKTGDTPDAAFERADKALYAAKKEGRNRCISG
jgi:diguanylate cyclase